MFSRYVSIILKRKQAQELGQKKGSTFLQGCQGWRNEQALAQAGGVTRPLQRLEDRAGLGQGWRKKQALGQGCRKEQDLGQSWRNEQALV